MPELVLAVKSYVSTHNALINKINTNCVPINIKLSDEVYTRNMYKVFHTENIIDVYFQRGENTHENSLS